MRKDEPRSDPSFRNCVTSLRLDRCGFLCLFGCLTGGRFFLLLGGGCGTLVELVNAARGVDELLLAREQRMASRADFDRNIL